MGRAGRVDAADYPEEAPAMTDSTTDDRPCCPACTTAEMVSRYAGPDEWICYGCSRTFDTGGDR